PTTNINTLSLHDALPILSKRTYNKLVQNLIWATGYNVIALPLAAGVLAPWGIILSPAVGAILMSLSTIIVAINAQLLHKTKLRVDRKSTRLNSSHDSIAY